jgi:hypothetical protein
MVRLVTKKLENKQNSFKLLHNTNIYIYLTLVENVEDIIIPNKMNM